MVSFYRAMEVIYRLLLYGALPYLLWYTYGLDLWNLLLIYICVFILDTLCDICGTIVYRHDEFKLIKGLPSLFTITMVLVMLALLLNLDVAFVYLVIPGLLGAIAFIFSSKNRTFNPFGFTTMTFLTLSVLLAVLLTPVFLVLPILYLLTAVFLVGRGLDEMNASPLTRVSTYLRLGITLGLSITLAVLTFNDWLKILTSTEQFNWSNLSDIPIVFLGNFIIAIFEEFLGRAFIPFVGAGLASYAFSSLHIPKLMIGYIEMNNLTHILGLSPLFAMYLTICVMAWLCIGTMLFVETWRKSGLLGSILTHAIVNTVIYMIATGLTTGAIALTITLMVLHYIFGKRTGFKI